MFQKLFRKKEFKYLCEECGSYHRGSPSFSHQFPTYFYDVPEAERENRIKASDDLCTILPAENETDADAIYCIRVILEIPIEGTQQPFTWGVWVSQSKESFDRYVETFETDQSGEQSFGWLAVDMPFYSNTPKGEPLTHLESEVYWGGKGQRPKIILWENNHPLSKDQMNGISWDRASMIANLANKDTLNSTKLV
jgi:hypothetical protein